MNHHLLLAVPSVFIIGGVAYFFHRIWPKKKQNKKPPYYERGTY